MWWVFKSCLVRNLWRFLRFGEEEGLGVGEIASSTEKVEPLTTENAHREE